MLPCQKAKRSPECTQVPLTSRPFSTTKPSDERFNMDALERW
ncbi:hypothetical protein [Rubritalea tangerina]